jgi:hypothetical protein
MLTYAPSSSSPGAAARATSLAQRSLSSSAPTVASTPSAWRAAASIVRGPVAATWRRTFSRPAPAIHRIELADPSRSTSSPRRYGINFLDDARYNDETGTDAAPFLEASRAASDLGVPQPCAAQLPYSIVRRDWVEIAEMGAALEASGAGVVASFVMAGGVLTGKYESGAAGRAAGELDQPQYAAARDCGRRLSALAEEVRVSAAALAIAFALRNQAVTSVLFGATSPSQIGENVAALDVEPDVVERLGSPSS